MRRRRCGADRELAEFLLPAPRSQPGIFARRGLYLLPAAFLLGLAMTSQWQTQQARSPYVSRYYPQLAEAAFSLQKEQDGLRDQLADLRSRLDEIQRESASLGGEAAALQRQIEDLKPLAGLTALEGPGLVVTLDDARLPATAKNIERSIVHSQDITDVVNAAWKAGAEAIAINGERIVGTSSCVGATIQINGRLMSPPYVINVIGSSEDLYRAFNDRDELADLKSRRDLNGFGFQFARATEVRVAAYTGALLVRHVSVQ
jgi:uncharacterized protein YlxW (UPF0749 family)